MQSIEHRFKLLIFVSTFPISSSIVSIFVIFNASLHYFHRKCQKHSSSACFVFLHNVSRDMRPCEGHTQSSNLNWTLVNLCRIFMILLKTFCSVLLLFSNYNLLILSIRLDLIISCYECDQFKRIFLLSQVIHKIIMIFWSRVSSHRI